MSGTWNLLIIIPAFNEEAAVGAVVAEVNAVLPGVPVLVIDDCSGDATATSARNAGARVLALPTHLGLGGCVQAGYKLAFELGYEFVIRVDGDGQHDPHDIPGILAKLKQTGCQMVIGSRYLVQGGKFTSPVRGAGIMLFRLVLRPILGKWVSDSHREAAVLALVQRVPTLLQVQVLRVRLLDRVQQPHKLQQRGVGRALARVHSDSIGPSGLSGGGG